MNAFKRIIRMILIVLLGMELRRLTDWNFWIGFCSFLVVLAILLYQASKERS